MAGLSFETGFLQGKKALQSPLVIEKAAQSPQIEPEAGQNQINAKDSASAQNSVKTSSTTLPKNCAYVGSKNSNKYHLPSCQWAKRIKPENVVCFSSAEEATAKNYQPDKGCIK